MLYKIAFPENNEEFKKCIKNVEDAYWPEEEYKSLYSSPSFSFKISGGNDEKIFAELNNTLKDMLDRIYQKGLYTFHSADGTIEKMLFPFVDRFHSFFLQRKWHQDPIHLMTHPIEVFRLHRETNGNYSKHSGNYYHFINVIAAVARLINFFSDPECIKKYLLKSNEKNENIAELCNILAFNKHQNSRIINLMFGAFYHDLGKTVVDPRHGMEGAIIISDHTSSAWYQLNRISNRYNDSDSEQFEREDLLFIAEMLMYHDLYGTLSTGESGYSKLIAMIDRVKIYSLKYISKIQSNSIQEQIKWSQRYLFDLWLLNVADIIVSLKNNDINFKSDKYKQQTFWLDKSKADKRLDDFFTNKKKAHILLHDLRISFKLLKEHNKFEHNDSLTSLSKDALSYTERHIVERIRRLIFESLTEPLEVYEHIKEITMLVKYARYYIESEREVNIYAIIVRAIKSVSNYQEFCNRIKWIGHMDYALGFFQKIANGALEMVTQELKGGDNTYWIRTKTAGPIGLDSKAEEYLWKLQAKFFLDNFASTVIQILSHLLFRDEYIDRLRNLEFNDARERLTKEKIKAIISLVGPYRSRRAIQLILQSIFYW
jgi:hypothetical protein